MNEIIVALDNIPKQRALELAKAMSGKVWGFKVNDLLIEHGVSIVDDLREFGNVFADPKLHDIPNTVQNSIRRLVGAGANMVTIHLSGGLEMIQAAMTVSGECCKIIGVTMLTSLSPNSIRQVYRGFPLERLCDLAIKSKIHGIVCSANEIPFWNSTHNLIKVVPGVRPNGPLPNDDQARFCDTVNADFVVIGRPILTAPDPIRAIDEFKCKLGRSC